NVYLQQKSEFFRHTHRLLDRVLDSPALLNRLSGLSSSTDAKDLGELTVSVMKGADGKQKKELDRLVDWLQWEYKPELVHLNNCMFLGMAPEIKNRLNVPVVCGLTGEDLFVEDMPEPYRSETLNLMQERSQDIDAFISPSNYYADFMSDYLKIPRDKLHVVPLGIRLEGHGATGGPSSVPSRPNQNPFILGYLARVCPEKGFHVAAEVFEILAKKLGGSKVKFRAAGYLSKKDLPFFQKTLKQIEGSGFYDSFEYWGEVDRNRKIEFLHSIDVLSVPSPYKEPKGLYILEALANGVPVVQPPHGSFPELIEATGGGILAASASANDIADAIHSLIEDPAKLKELGERGKNIVHAKFSDEQMAQRTINLYSKVVSAS
ncbi:MAG TPA: glycosyltransferase family 4 protein, partial [Acidobacteriota bacterium]|nr:glycosyltransferase family 4 protein [Acidobacteriota bacterium]